MATLEDKILGEKREYYCSDSSEDESERDNNENHSTEYISKKSTKWEGVSSNTGPKGVIRDWERFKELQKEKQIEKAVKMQEMIQKCSMTCQSALDEEKDKTWETDPELLNLSSDEYLQEYRNQRMQEMLDKMRKLHFGSIINLTSTEEFLNAIDNEDKSVTVVIHIFEKSVSGCEAMNGCLITLAKTYPFVKFCKILGSVVSVSNHFKQEGVPALLVYKNGQIIGNFVRVTENLGEDFYASDVETFLTERGILSYKNGRSDTIP